MNFVEKKIDHLKFNGLNGYLRTCAWEQWKSENSHLDEKTVQSVKEQWASGSVSLIFYNFVEMLQK